MIMEEFGEGEVGNLVVGVCGTPMRFGHYHGKTRSSTSPT